MGSWGSGIFDDDVAADVKSAFEAALEAGATVPAATREVREEFGGALEDDDDGPIVILALASLQWERGKLQERLKKQALGILDAGRGLERWEDQGERALTERRAIYEQLRRLLASPSPTPSPRPRRPRPRPNFREGDWFAVPLDGGGIAVGLVARYRKGYAPGLFTYFFGPRRPAVPSPGDLRALRPGDAIHACITSYLGLMNGEWVVIGRDDAWEPEQWPLPDFARRYRGSGMLVRLRRRRGDAVPLVARPLSEAPPTGRLRPWRASPPPRRGPPRTTRAARGWPRGRSRAARR